MRKLIYFVATSADGFIAGPAGQFVYVVKDDMTVEVRRVPAARSEGDMAVIAAGALAPNEKVVVRGALRLAPGSKVSIVEPARGSKS